MRMHTGRLLWLCQRMGLPFLLSEAQQHQQPAPSHSSCSSHSSSAQQQPARTDDQRPPTTSKHRQPASGHSSHCSSASAHALGGLPWAHACCWQSSSSCCMTGVCSSTGACAAGKSGTGKCTAGWSARHQTLPAAKVVRYIKADVSGENRALLARMR